MAESCLPPPSIAAHDAEESEAVAGGGGGIGDESSGRAAVVVGLTSVVPFITAAAGTAKKVTAAGLGSGPQAPS